MAGESFRERAVRVCSALSIGMLLASTGVAENGGTFTLIVDVTGFESDRGTFGLGLYEPQHAAFFPSGTAKGQYLDSGRAQIREKRVTFTFEHVPYGTYAVSAYHDENGNGVFDKNFIGVPKEAWAVSNNVRATLSAPSFEAAQFTVSDGAVERISLELE